MTTHVVPATPITRPPPPNPAPPCVLVVFGGGGDLTHRKLVPALFRLFELGLLDPRFAAIGVGRRDWDDDAYRRHLEAAIAEHRPSFDRGRWEEFARAMRWVPGVFEDPATYQTLRARVAELGAGNPAAENLLHYLATPPSEFATILRQLAAARLVTPPGHGKGWTRAVIEKPFGHDLETARELNLRVAEVLDESQTYRIDHYLGKETVQNLLVFRFANSMFEPLWNRKYVDYVEIVASESIGVGTRGRFYDSVGVLRDIVQNHLLEVLALVAMEPPARAGADDVRGEKLKVLGALRQPWDDTIVRDLALGQYRGYRGEPGVAPDSITPTFAALRVFVDNWRWQGVPFYLRAGKRLPRRVTEVALHMQRIPLSLFGREDVCEHVAPNVLRLRIQPDEGISLTFASKIPGYDLAVGSVAMDMTYREAFGGDPPEAYERLLLDAMRGDATLFSRRDAVETSWTWITPILEYFERHPPRDFPNYEPGTWGPESARHLIRLDRRDWCEI